LLSVSTGGIVSTSASTKVSMSVGHMPPLPEVEEAQIVTSRFARVVYAALGFLFLAIGIAGYVVPVLPGTVFLLIAAGLFFKSSERMYFWVLNNRRFGPTVRAYRAGYGIRRKVKAYAITLMLLSVGLSIVFAVDGAAIRLFLAALAAFGTAFILTRPTTEDVLARR
jgi:uncharacterized membrane protein YbaN (DUF454 family)